MKRRIFCVGVAAGLVPWTVGCAQATPPKPGFSGSTTYLHLLAKTPFFTALSREQLQYVIDHSREWRVAAGAEIANSSEAPDNFWVLLDGGWQVEHAGKVQKAGHADPAKWYGGPDMAMLPGASKLAATAQSYVMTIRLADLQAMKQQGFAFDRHIQDGMAFYRTFLKP